MQAFSDSGAKLTIVISAVNIFEAGPLSILTDCLEVGESYFTDHCQIVALVHKKNLFDLPNVMLLEFPASRKSWFHRLYYEYWHFNKLSRQLRPDIWLSLNDFSPSVKCGFRAVYCHNPLPFYRMRLADVFFAPRTALLSLFYNLLHQINVQKNQVVIVQQEWLRHRFRSRHGISNIAVAYPSVSARPRMHSTDTQRANVPRFFYPALPRAFKNHQLIGEAVRLLDARGIRNFEVIFTFDPTENRLATFLREQYGGFAAIKFVGRLTRNTVFEYYETTDYLLFPSLLETWGLPITEFRSYKKPMLLADLPYARENAGGCEKVAFFDPRAPEQLARLMEQCIRGENPFIHTSAFLPESPFAQGWEELFNYLLEQQINQTKKG